MKLSFTFQTVKLEFPKTVESHILINALYRQ